MTFTYNPAPKPTHNRNAPKRGTHTKFSQKVRIAIIERDGGLCVKCKWPYHNIHHVTFASQGGAGEAWNGVCVCHVCHDLAHRDIEVRRWFEDYRDKYLRIGA
jgi:5-methylcytosine-specific restriction endonuclease McrA